MWCLRLAQDIGSGSRPSLSNFETKTIPFFGHFTKAHQLEDSCRVLVALLTKRDLEWNRPDIQHRWHRASNSTRRTVHFLVSAGSVQRLFKRKASPILMFRGKLSCLDGVPRLVVDGAEIVP